MAKQPSIARRLGALLPRLTGIDRTSDDRRLVEACLRGSDEAWGALLEKYQNLIFSIPLKYGATREDAADIFQTVCLELYNDLGRLRKVDNLRPWLMTVTAHQAFHWKHRRERRTRSETAAFAEREPELALPPALTADLEREQLVREAVAKLSPRCRELVRLLFYEQPAWSYAQVARELRLKTGSIGFIRGRCLKKLERLIEELGF